jgi:glyoxylase-like metal-dependent hydrolase (beta-lactamase superfamily II)
MQLKEGIHRLPQGVVNFYLIEDGGKLLLVDAGTPGDWDLLVRAVADLGRRLDDLEAVLLTHAHADHIGTAERARTTAHARVWVHQADAAMATGATPPRNDGKVGSYLLGAEFYRTLFSLARRGPPGSSL